MNVLSIHEKGHDGQPRTGRAITLKSFLYISKWVPTV